MDIKKILRKLRFFQFNSNFLKKILGLFFKEGKIYTIPLGPLRGFKLKYDRSVNYHAMMGLWESQSFKLLDKVIDFVNKTRANPIVCDVGANIGYYSLYFSRYIKKGHIFAFEPAPVIAARLQENIFINHIQNVQVYEFACSDQVGEIDFFIGFHHHASSLNEDHASSGRIVPKKIKVKTTTLDNFFSENCLAWPDLIKMDIEGGGVFALKSCDICIRNKRPIFLIESHNPDEDRSIRDLISCHDYQAYRINNYSWVEARTEVHPCQQGVWGSLILLPSEHFDVFKKILHE